VKGHDFSRAAMLPKMREMGLQPHAADLWIGLNIGPLSAV
jgi:hypothetical protein